MKRMISAICVLGIAVPCAFSQQGDKEGEIKRVRKELMQLQTERQKNKLEMAKDKQDFEEYMKRTAERLAAVKDETNSIIQQTAVQQRKNDSLAAQINYANSKEKQAEMSQDAMREKLASSCDQIITGLNRLPPMLRQNLVSSAALLKNELRGKSVDNVEALNRLQQILLRADDATGSIQVSQESSPISEVRGTVYRLRIGTFFEAAVNLKGEECAIWYGSDTTKWKPISDLGIAAELLKAANIREGKSVPAFVSIPLVPSESEKGGNQ